MIAAMFNLILAAAFPAAITEECSETPAATAATGKRPGGTAVGPVRGLRARLAAGRAERLAERSDRLARKSDSAAGRAERLASRTTGGPAKAQAQQPAAERQGRDACQAGPAARCPAVAPAPRKLD